MFTNRGRGIRNWITLTPLRTAAAGVMALALVAGGGYGIHQWLRARHYCSAGVVHLRGQCIGVTDGRYLFAGPHSQLAIVERAIARQNELISGQPHATIALLLPLTDPDADNRTEILHEVQGAYAAQYGADDARQSNSDPVKIRLVLANPGVNSVHWRPVVRRLAGMTGAPDNLRVVFGISVSTQQTEAEVAQLTRKDGIPVVTGAPTADSFMNRTSGPQSFPGLARVSPSDAQEATALTRFAKVDKKYAILVADKRGDGDTKDDYIDSLTSGYLGDTVSSYGFTSPNNESNPGEVQAQFGGDLASICQTHARWIYFAGRQVQLAIFLNALAGQGQCHRKITVITGDAAAHLIKSTMVQPADFTTGEITLYYPAIASPQAGGSPASLSLLAKLLRAQPIGPVGLADGETIINYDAALTGIAAINRYFDAAADFGATRKLPTPYLVGQEWSGLRVPGASGTICLDGNGDPYDKAIDIMQMTDGHSGFVAPRWPDKTPLGGVCDPPRGS